MNEMFVALSKKALSNVLIGSDRGNFSLVSLAFHSFPVLLQESYVTSAVNLSVIQFTVLQVFRVELDFYLQQRCVKYFHFCTVSRGVVTGGCVGCRTPLTSEAVGNFLNFVLLSAYLETFRFVNILSAIFRVQLERAPLFHSSGI